MASAKTRKPVPEASPPGFPVVQRRPPTPGPPGEGPRPAKGSTATMRSMTEEEIDAFVSTRGFGILSLSDGSRAYGVPLFYGAHDGTAYFQTRAGKKTHYLYATMEACLTIASPRGSGEWASVQLLGRLERIDALGPASLEALADVPPPFAWDEDDPRAQDAGHEGITTFRLVPTQRVGRLSQPATLDARESEIGF